MKILRAGLCGCFCKSKEHGSEFSWDALGVCIMHRCADIVLVMWSNAFFFCVLLLPSGLGDVSIETLTDSCRTESKSLRRKWTHKGSIKCIGKPEIWHLESFHCSDKMTVVCCYFHMQADRTHAVSLYFTPTWCILFSNFFFLGKLGANHKLFFLLGNTAENSWIIYFMHFSSVYLDACKLTL